METNLEIRLTPEWRYRILLPSDRNRSGVGFLWG